MVEKFDFDDITIVPEILSNINTRKMVIPYAQNGSLPLFTAPMDTVVDRYNFMKFKSLGINICLPRNEKVWDDECFESLSLEEFAEFLKIYKTKYYSKNETKRILVDIANGHMTKLYDMCKEFCELKYSENHSIMVGNIANPKTFQKYASLGVDFLRVGIGGGGACLTSANTGIHYPMASLIHECFLLSKEHGYKSKIVADGGFRNFDEIIKALSLGADFVMLGGIFNKSLESCSEIKLFKKITLKPKTAEKVWDNLPFLRKYMYKSFRGMSTKEVQKKWNRNEIKTSEGIVKYNKVEFKIEKWVENFEDYLKSAMSYTNSENLQQFKECEHVYITINALKRFKK